MKKTEEEGRSKIARRTHVAPPAQETHPLRTLDREPNLPLPVPRETCLGARLNATRLGEEGREEPAVAVLVHRVDLESVERVNRPSLHGGGTKNGFRPTIDGLVVSVRPLELGGGVDLGSDGTKVNVSAGCLSRNGARSLARSLACVNVRGSRRSIPRRRGQPAFKTRESSKEAGESDNMPVLEQASRPERDREKERERGR